MSTYLDNTAPVGCRTCLAWSVGTGDDEQLLEGDDVIDAFGKAVFRSAKIHHCQGCGTPWFSGYEETWEDVPIEKEFGHRHYLRRPLDERQILLLSSSIGDLDILEFGYEPALDCLDRIHDGLQRCARLWIETRGQIAEIERIGLGLGEAPPPAPGLDAIIDEIATTMEALAVIDARLIAPLGTGPDECPPTTDGLRVLDMEARLYEWLLGRSNRRLAQLLFGVNACRGPAGDTDLVDRVGTDVILRASFDGLALPDDDPPCCSTTLDEMQIELAGLLSRMLLERSWSLELVTPTARRKAWVTVDDGDDDYGLIVVSSNDDPVLWEDPIVVMEVVDHLLDGLTDLPSVTIAPT